MSAATQQGISTGITTMQHITGNDAMAQVQSVMAGFQKQSLRVIASCALVFLVSAYHEDDKQKQSLEDAQKGLRQLLADKAQLKRSTIDRYLNTALMLCRKMIATHGAHGGVVLDVLKAKTAAKGMQHIVDCILHETYTLENFRKLSWNTDADDQPVFSLDILRVNLGLDKYDPPASNKDGAETETRTGSQGPRSATEKSATKAHPESIVARVIAEPASLKTLPESSVMAVVDGTIGRKQMVARAISLGTAEDCLFWQNTINARLQELAKATPETSKDKPKRQRRQAAQAEEIPPVNTEAANDVPLAATA